MSLKRRLFTAFRSGKTIIFRVLLAIFIIAAFYFFITDREKRPSIVRRNALFFGKGLSSNRSLVGQKTAGVPPMDVETNHYWWEENITKTVEWDMLRPLPGHAARHSPNMEKRVLKLTDDLSHYFSFKMKSFISCQMEGKCPVRTLIFDVSNHNLSYGGTGDRLRGMASLLYIALASERVLQIKWETPANLGELFAGVAYDNVEYEKFLSQQGANVSRSDYYFRLYEGDAPVFFAKTSIISTNEICLQWLNFVSSNANLRKQLDIIVYRTQKYNLTFGFELATFMSLRVLLGKPKRNMEEATAKLWGKVSSQKHESCRLGLQLRATPSGLYGRYVENARFTQKQVDKCWLPKVMELAKECVKSINKKSTPIVYLTSDSVQTKFYFHEVLRKANITSVDSEFKQPYHLDNDMRSLSLKDRIRAMVETFAEWFVLSRMNQLIISRSGFGELASTYGSFLAIRRPTYRLPLGLSEQCNFEEDFHLRSSALEGIP